MQLKRLLALGAVPAVVMTGALVCAGPANAAADPCGGTRVGYRTLKFDATTLGDAALYQTGVSGSTTHYCLVVNRTIGAPGLLEATSFGISGQSLRNVRGNHSRTTQVVHRRDVTHCSTCTPYHADAEIQLDDAGTQWGGRAAITRFTLG